MQYIAHGGGVSVKSARGPRHLHDAWCRCEYVGRMGRGTGTSPCRGHGLRMNLAEPYLAALGATLD